MPELPEVETTRRGIAPHIVGQTITGIVIREPRLRWPVPARLAEYVSNQRIERVDRRGKYLLLEVETGNVIVHLGMSGSLRLVTEEQSVRTHDHLDICLGSGWRLRLNDPRRFGAVLWQTGHALTHPLLKHLGPEPLGEDFTGEYLYHRAQERRSSVKAFIMDHRVVVGVGNIYASESLFLSAIAPARAANRIARHRYDQLAEAIRSVLEDAIEAGGTTLRDFVGSDGKPGYFRQHLRVYGRANLPCPQCGDPIRVRRLAQRATYDCPRCQH